MKKIFPMTALIMMLFSLAACSSTVKLDQSNDGQTINLNTGQKLVIALEDNPTTGYNWEVGEIDGSIIEQVGEADFKADSVLIGSGGVVTLTFTGVAPGEAHLKLVYHKSWEADVAPLEEFNITIHVK